MAPKPFSPACGFARGSTGGCCSIRKRPPAIFWPGTRATEWPARGRPHATIPAVRCPTSLSRPTPRRSSPLSWPAKKRSSKAMPIRPAAFSAMTPRSSCPTATSLSAKRSESPVSAASGMPTNRIRLRPLPPWPCGYSAGLRSCPRTSSRGSVRYCALRGFGPSATPGGELIFSQQTQVRWPLSFISHFRLQFAALVLKCAVLLPTGLAHPARVS